MRLPVVNSSRGVALLARNETLAHLLKRCPRAGRLFSWLVGESHLTKRGETGYLVGVSQYIATAKNGRLVLDVATDLPDGTEVVLFPLGEDTVQEEDSEALQELLLREDTKND